ncbi:hypothetical protein FI667_g489, partial [Globisporangium splendens]
MSLGGLIPIAGAGGGGGADNAKKSNDLTSGLISIGGQKGGGTGDIDMSDLDVDDLLAEGNTTPSSSKKKSGKNSSSSPQKDSKKKKSSKSKDKDSKKKEKKKDDSIAAFDEISDRFDDDEKGWSSKTKDTAKSSRWDDDSSDLAAAASAGGEKKMGNLNAEFAKMLGLEDDFAVVSGGDGQIDEGITPFGDGNDRSADNSVEDTFSYTPRMRGGNDDKKRGDDGGGAFSNDIRDGTTKTHSDPFGAASSTAASGSEEPDTVGGLSASFSPKTTPPKRTRTRTIRRCRSSRRQRRDEVGEEAVAEQHQMPVQLKTHLHLLDQGVAEEDTNPIWIHYESPTLERTRRAVPESEEPTGKDKEKDSLATRKTISSTPDLSKAKDDLLSELFPSEPPVRDRSTKEEQSPKQEPTLSLGSAKDDLLAELFPADPPPKQQQPRQIEGFRRDGVDEEKKSEPYSTQQGDLLAELFPADKAKSRVSFDDQREDEKKSKAVEDASKKDLRDEEESTFLSEKRRETRDRDTITPPKLQPRPVERQPQKTATLGDISSAKESLLMDLFPDMPPQKPREGRRGSRSSTPSTSPVKEASPTEVREAGSSYSPARAASSSPQKSPQRVDEQSPRRSAATTTNLSKDQLRLEAQVSPGRAKTLASPSASSIKGADFEQSKGSLLEELFSPPSPGNEQTRRNSYSQSFEDEKSDVVEDEHSPRRRRSSLAANVSSPSKSSSPEKRSDEHPARASSSSTSPLLQEADNSCSTKDPSGHGEAASIVQRETKVVPTTFAQSPAQDPQVSGAILASALKAREDELLAEADAAKAMLAATHASEIAQLNELINSLTQQLSNEKAKNLTLSCEHDHQLVKLKILEQKTQAFMQQITGLQSEKQQLQQELSLVQAQHALCANQSALFQAERTGFMNQLKNLEDQNRQLVHQFTQERQDHQAAMLKFTSFQQEKEQEAQLQKQKESRQMGKLFQQLQTSLVSLKMLQEQVAEKETTKHEMENESRMRMITSLETSSRRNARQTEEECTQLSSLLNSLETTLHHYRQEHLEEKERL